VSADTLEILTRNTTEILDKLKEIDETLAGIAHNLDYLVIDVGKIAKSIK